MIKFTVCISYSVSFDLNVLQSIKQEYILRANLRYFNWFEIVQKLVAV